MAEVEENGTDSPRPDQAEACDGSSRREFMRKAGKAAYIAPTLSVLALVSVEAAAQLSPPPPPGSPLRGPAG